MSSAPVKKAVIAVAGYGTRFLPATKAVPKELLPIVDKPIVQYLVEEAVASGIEEIILVTRAGGGGIENHFDSARDLEVHLQEQGSQRYLDVIQAIPKLASFAYVRQARHLPYGNGTPLLAAKGFIGRGEPFVYMFGDDLVLSDVPCVRQLLDLYEQHHPAAVIAFQEVAPEETCRYGIAKLKPGTRPAEMESIVEKPAAGAAPTNLAQIGRFVLSSEVIDILEGIHVKAGKELYLTDAIAELCRKKPVLVHPIEGEWLTTGDPLRFMMASIKYALRDGEIGTEFARFLSSLQIPRS
jgi:UTP--glucose-1-phosphate uridylyltransferase